MDVTLQPSSLCQIAAMPQMSTTAPRAAWTRAGQYGPHLHNRCFVRHGSFSFNVFCSSETLKHQRPQWGASFKSRLVILYLSKEGRLRMTILSTVWFCLLLFSYILFLTDKSSVVINGVSSTTNKNGTSNWFIIKSILLMTTNISRLLLSIYSHYDYCCCCCCYYYYYYYKLQLLV